MFPSLVSETLTSRKGTLVGECELVNQIYTETVFSLLYTRLSLTACIKLIYQVPR